MRNTQRQTDLILSLAFGRIADRAQSSEAMAFRRRRLQRMARRSLYPAAPEAELVGEA